MINGCPGAAQVKNSPALEVKTCPSCGKEVEVFTSQNSTTCSNCGQPITNTGKV